MTYERKNQKVSYGKCFFIFDGIAFGVEGL
jgi:hypothetical protein